MDESYKVEVERQSNLVAVGEDDSRSNDTVVADTTRTKKAHPVNAELH
jgi:hypothetical protein